MLAKLIDSIVSLSPREGLQRMRSIVPPPTRIYFNDSHYTRNSLLKTPDYELVAICWRANQIAPKHNHSCDHCRIYVYRGSLVESKYDGDELISTSQLNENDLTMISYDEHSHSVKALTDAITLHLYN